MANESMKPGPLAGLRVIEITNRIGQFCGKQLADFGADVIKIEPPGGIAERRVGPFYHDIPDPDRSLSFWHYNTSKRGVTLDLEREEGREILHRLVAGADILLESTRPGWLPSLGLTYESFAADNPALIMCSLTPFGQTGPWRDYLDSDMLQLAAGGQMAGCGYDVADDPAQQPIAPGGGNAYHVGGVFAYIAVMSAVFSRHMTGEGQYLDVSVHEACALTTEAHVPTWIYLHNPVYRQTGRHAGNTPSPVNQLLTADGRYIQTTGSAMQPARLGPLIAWMEREGRAEDLTDPKYQDPAQALVHRDHVMDVLRKFVRSMDGDEAMKGGQEIAGVGWGLIRTPEEILGDEHFEERGFFVPVEHPELGETFTYSGASGVFNASPWRISRRAPLIGEHNAEVLATVGVDAATLDQLRASGVV